MTSQEKSVARILFKLKVHEFDGNSFETFFTNIMDYAETDFRQIKPWGNLGDRKNDGYIRPKGVYYQVFAPENIKKSYPDAVKKIRKDFEGLLEHWKPVNEYYFLINDKYKGVNADSENEISDIVKEYTLLNGGILTAKDLEKITFQLEDDQIFAITGFLPDVANITNLNFSELNQVIGHIMNLPITSKSGIIKFPEWNEKIEFNDLSPYVANQLNTASLKLGALNEYLENEPFLADELQKRLISLYSKITQEPLDTTEKYRGDFIFWKIVKECSPKNIASCEAAVLTIMAKYFESCDIFEEPQTK